MIKSRISHGNSPKASGAAAIGGLVLPLLILIGPSQAAQDSTAVVVPIAELSFERQVDVGVSAANIAFDKKYVYISSPDGFLFRTDSLNSGSELIHILQANEINKIYVYDGALYVLTTPNEPESQTEPEHALFQSRDHGRSFTPIDQGLKECMGGTCQYLVSSQLFATRDRIYTNAGADLNLLVSNDEGDNWTALSGSVSQGLCTPSTFKIAHRTVFQGGECPLDVAFLKRGILREDMLSWIPGHELQPVEAPDLSNRQIMAIEQPPDSRLVLVGAEGALLRSIDDGHSFEYAFRYESGSGSYPYVQHILFPSSYSTAALIAGFDKDTQRPYLAYGTGNGEKWNDISHLIPVMGSGTVTDLEEDNGGRIFAVIADIEAKRIIIAEVALDRSSF